MKPCKYCGNNPVPHFVYFINESLNILFTPIRQVILYNFFTKIGVKRLWGKKISAGLLFIGEFLNIVTRQNDLTKCKVRRAQVLWEEAQKRGMEMQELLLFGKPFDCYIVGPEVPRTKFQEPNKFQIQNSKFQIIFSGLPRPAGYFNNKLDLMDDKAWFKKFMKKNGLPVPEGGAVTNFKQAKKILQRVEGIGNKVETNAIYNSIPYTLTPKPYVIVKPRSGSRGRHSTTFISTEKELKIAFKIAKQLCHWVVVEQQLFGPVYRATVINFKLEGVLRGDSPQVVGNGKQTISELVLEKNSQTHPGVKDIILDAQAENFVARQIIKQSESLEAKRVLSSLTPKKNYSPVRQDSGRLESSRKADALAFVFGAPPSDATRLKSAFDFIPKKDQIISLTEKIGVNYGGSSSEDFEICHTDNIELFEKAARVLGDPILGFDFIIPDISKSYKQQSCGFIEVNTLPFINLHHDPLLGKPRNIAAKILDLV
jgi:hypothetical protein